MDELYKRAHRVKGGVGTLRAKRAMYLAQEIEAAARRTDKEGAGKLVAELVAELRHIGGNIRDLRGQPD
jgi:HPt (histidine-containing phosphotransfer) domain-containing protein